MLRRKNIIYAGAALFAIGAILMIWFLVKRHSGAGEWQVNVDGNQILSEKEVQEVVVYLLRAANDGVSSNEIKDALLLNPRIATAYVTVLPGRRVNVSITERSLEYLQHEENGVAEKDPSGQTIAEGVSKIHKDFTPDKVIFYLTFGGESMVSPRRDIIRLWKQTRDKYSFLWQRISEIEIRPLRGDLYRFRIFSAGLKSCTVFEGRFSEETLRRLWAVFAYLEVKLPHAMTLVDLQENSAIIREMKSYVRDSEADS